MTKTNGKPDQSQAKKDEDAHRAWREYEEGQLKLLAELLLDIYMERHEDDNSGSNLTGS